MRPPIESINPATGEVVARVEPHGEDEVDRRLAAAAAAFPAWRDALVQRRAAFLAAAAARLRAERDHHARLMTAEMGKPIAQAEAEIEKCAWGCEYYAEHAESFLAPEPVTAGEGRSYVRFDPLGIVLAVMPWNFPYWQVFRFAAPALAAGNAVLLKHASNVPRSALAIEELLHAAGLERGLFTTLLVDGEGARAVASRPEVAAVTLTGSEAAGAAVASEAGRALKKTVLELGGSDPFIVLEDADLDRAVPAAVTARLVNNGQSCIAAKRFIAVESVAGEFERRFAAALRQVATGDPAERATELGPLARADLVRDLHRQVEESVARGARLVTGGAPADRPGFYYAPTLLADVRPGMPAFDEETFGPVAALVRARDADEAVELANRSRYGLGASVWTRDANRGEAIARRLEVGCVFVNGIVKSDPRLPFGGVKRSGYGRELARFGIREFVNVKSVWVAG